MVVVLLFFKDALVVVGVGKEVAIGKWFNYILLVSPKLCYLAVILCGTYQHGNPSWKLPLFYFGM